jgi:hypothetical protein
MPLTASHLAKQLNLYQKQLNLYQKQLNQRAA